MKLKTKKIIMLVSCILVLLLDLSYAFNIFSGNIDLESFNTDISISNTSQAIFLSICAITNFILLFFIYKNPIENKKRIILLSILQILLGNIFNIVVGILCIILVCNKTKDVEIPVKEKKPLPEIENITKHKWYVYFSIFVFLFIICYTPFTNLLPSPTSRFTALLYIALLYIVQITFLIVPIWNELKRDTILFIKNFKIYISNMLPRFGIIFLAYLFANLSLVSLIGNISTNQSIINSWPLYVSAPIAIIIAPLTEELMFRGFMKKFIKNDIVFLILSSLIFGGLHVTVASSIPQLLFIIPYSILGFAFSLNYVKTRNIASNIFLHASWNAIAIIALIISNIVL